MARRQSSRSGASSGRRRWQRDPRQIERWGIYGVRWRRFCGSACICPRRLPRRRCTGRFGGGRVLHARAEVAGRCRRLCRRGDVERIGLPSLRHGGGSPRRDGVVGRGRSHDGGIGGGVGCKRVAPPHPRQPINHSARGFPSLRRSRYAFDLLGPYFSKIAFATSWWKSAFLLSLSFSASSWLSMLFMRQCIARLASFSTAFLTFSVLDFSKLSIFA